MGAAAVELLMDGQSRKAVGIVSDEINVVDLEFAVDKKHLKVDNLYGLMKVLT